jgi:hypothetical protein
MPAVARDENAIAGVRDVILEDSRRSTDEVAEIVCVWKKIFALIALIFGELETGYFSTSVPQLM